MGFEIWPKSAKGDDSDRRILKGDGIVFDRRTFKGDDYWPKNDIIFGWVLTEDCYYGDDYYLKNALPLDFEGWPKSAKGDDLTEEFLKGKIIDWRMLYFCLIIDRRMLLCMSAQWTEDCWFDLVWSIIVKGLCEYDWSIFIKGLIFIEECWYIYLIIDWRMILWDDLDWILLKGIMINWSYIILLEDIYD